MNIFNNLKAARAFQKGSLKFLETMEDQDIVLEIGYHEELGAPLTVKQLTLIGIGSQATVHRRQMRLRRLGVIRQTVSRTDGRVVVLRLPPAIHRTYCTLLKILRAK